MRRRLTLLLAMLVVLSLVVALPAAAKKPAPNLSGPMNIVFDPPDGVCGPDISWYGTVELDGVPYGMTFESKPPSVFAGMTQHYWEEFTIYDGEFDEFPTQCPSGSIVLQGDLSGIGRFANGKITEHGIVTEANDPFEDWDGRRMHADGLVAVDTNGDPTGFKGTIRFN